MHKGENEEQTNGHNLKGRIGLARFKLVIASREIKKKIKGTNLEKNIFNHMDDGATIARYCRYHYTYYGLIL